MPGPPEPGTRVRLAPANARASWRGRTGTVLRRWPDHPEPRREARPGKAIFDVMLDDPDYPGQLVFAYEDEMAPIDRSGRQR